MNRRANVHILSFVLLLCLFTVYTPLSAASLASIKSQARSLYWGEGVAQNYTKAFELYRQAADQGDAEAKFICGGMLYMGMGVTKNIPLAFRYLHEAALLGKSTADSERILGQAFLQGTLVPRNYEKARQWYEAAAEKGDADAQNELGYMFFVGNGVPLDQQAGAEYFLQAAKGGLSIAQYNMGFLSMTGIGLPEADLVKAYAWMSLAAAGGYQAAQGVRDQLEQTLSQDEVRRAQEMALEFTKTPEANQ